MSKITAKNLHYCTSPPPFLARLKAGHAAQDGRSEIQNVRPRKGRSEDEEKEDEPLVFDEGTGESLTKGEWERRERGREAREEVQANSKEEEGTGLTEPGKVASEGLFEIGMGKKRKVGKLVGGEEGEAASLEGKPGGDIEKGKAKKKGKKIKLSFGDDQ